MHYPPFGALANVIVRGAHGRKKRSPAAPRWGGWLTPNPEGVEGNWGPRRRRWARLKNEYRYQMLLKSARPEEAERDARRLAEVRYRGEVECGGARGGCGSGYAAIRDS